MPRTNLDGWETPDRRRQIVGERRLDAMELERWLDELDEDVERWNRGVPIDADDQDPS